MCVAAAKYTPVRRGPRADLWFLVVLVYNKTTAHQNTTEKRKSMDVAKLCELLDAGFYTGVPDSLLQPLCDYLYGTYGVGRRHVVAANEGNCAALAAGYHLASGKMPVVYMQNSGIGNSVNPIVSLLNGGIYGIPCLFVIGLRGEPGQKDEPQHLYQGKITRSLLQTIGVHTFEVDAQTTTSDLKAELDSFAPRFKQGESLALLAHKGALTHAGSVKYQNQNPMERETIIRLVAEAAGQDVVVCTTGKASRELYEVREETGQGHRQDFLTVGSMGHASSIALGIALQKPGAKVWCLDGDGALLMHMGAMAVLGSLNPPNLVHIVLNNGAHQSVGGMPTAAGAVDVPTLAKTCGYPAVFSPDDYDALRAALHAAKTANRLTFIEAKCNLHEKENLGRPKEAPKENKDEFMAYLETL